VPLVRASSMEADLFDAVIPTVTIELFEAQRYQPRVGAPETRWSSDFLMPTERKRYRVQGSNSSWATSQEADEALLALGWSWDRQAWRAEPSVPCDKDGWIYGTTWTTNFDEGKTEPGQFDMVRWRRMMRLQSFSGAQAFTNQIGELRDCEGCPNVDLETAAIFSKQILEAMATASLRGEWSTSNLVKLKAALLDKLREQVPTQPRQLAAVLQEFVDAQVSVAGLVQKANKSVGVAAVASSFMSLGRRGTTQAPAAAEREKTEAPGKVDPEELAARQAELEAYFPLVEREVLAAFAMRRLCPELTCLAEDAMEPQHECNFRPLLCPNRGCVERLSQRTAVTHDRVCLFKVVACEQCGEEVLRRELERHRAAACPDRPIKCWFECIGCDRPLTYRTIERHLEECTQSHLMLMMQKMQEQQQQIADLHKEVENDKELFARAREADRKQLGELSLTVGSLRTKLEKQGELPEEVKKLQADLKALAAMKRR